MTDPNQAEEANTKAGSAQSNTGGEVSQESTKAGKADKAAQQADERTDEAVHRDAAFLLKADIDRQQRRISALATGLQEHHDALDEAEDSYDQVRESMDQPAVVAAYTALLNPVGIHSQSRQVDTSGLGGFGASSGVVHAADVFGSDIQRAVAALATRTAPDPVTVVGAVPQSDLVDPDSLSKAQTDKRDQRWTHEVKNDEESRSSSKSRSSESSNSNK